MENNIKLMVIYGDLIMNKEDYSKYYIQGSDHYLIPKDVFIELFDEMINWKEDSQKQKEVIDKIYELIKQHIRKDGFLELNEWQTRDLLKLLKEVSE